MCVFCVFCVFLCILCIFVYFVYFVYLCILCFYRCLLFCIYVHFLSQLRALVLSRLALLNEPGLAALQSQVLQAFVLYSPLCIIISYLSYFIIQLINQSINKL